MAAHLTSHTIVLLQATGNYQSRSYLDFPTVSAAIDAVVKMYEHKLNEMNPRAQQITYDVADLFKYIDSFNDICALVLDKSSGKYDPKDREWIKEKVRYTNGLCPPLTPCRSIPSCADRPLRYRTFLCSERAMLMSFYQQNLNSYVLGPGLCRILLQLVPLLSHRQDLISMFCTPFLYY